MNTLELLTQLGACKEALKWAEEHPGPREAWKSCDSVDWMFWLLGKNEATKTAIVELSCDNTIHALVHLPESQNETRRICDGTVDVVRRFLRGEAPLVELRAARSAAAIARSAAAAAAIARSADWSAAEASEAAAWSAWSAAESAGPAGPAENKWQCDHIRERFSADAIMAMFGDES